MQMNSNVAKVYALVPVSELVLETPRTYRCSDSDYDPTSVDFSAAESLTISQTDEFGKAHHVILSAQMVSQLMPHLIRWNALNN